MWAGTLKVYLSCKKSIQNRKVHLSWKSPTESKKVQKLVI